MFSIQKRGLKYDVSTTVRCPLCEDDIQVGTAGLQGLKQYQGKKKCLATISKKKKRNKMSKAQKSHLILIPSEERQGRATVCSGSVTTFDTKRVSTVK
jgi:hypothetical protein